MSGSIFRFCMKHLLVLVIGREASWRADRDYNSHGLVDPLTVITIVPLRDHDINRPLATSSVVPSHLLCAADVVVFEFELSPGCICLNGYFLLILTLWIITHRVVVLAGLKGALQ